MHNSDSAYLMGKYVFSPPPVYSGRWNAEDWKNYVTFTVPISDGYKISEGPDGNVLYRRGKCPDSISAE